MRFQSHPGNERKKKKKKLNKQKHLEKDILKSRGKFLEGY